MSILENFDIATDLKVQMYLPLEGGNVFVLGVSQLGGNQVLGTDNTGIKGWVNLEVEVNRVTTSIGGGISSNIHYQADAGHANLDLQSWTFDPANHSSMLPGTPVRLLLSRGLYERILWYGSVDDINVSYAPDQPNQIRIQATDLWASIVARRFDYAPDGEGSYGIDSKMYPSEAIDIAMTQLSSTGFYLPYTPDTDPAHEWFMTQTGANNTTFGAVVDNILTSGLGFIWVDPDTGELKYRARKESGTATYTIGNNHGEVGHLCMSDISTETNTDGIINSFLIKQKYEYLGNPVFEIAYIDQDSIDIFSERSGDYTVDLAETSDANKYMDSLVIPRPPTIVKSVTTPTIDRLGDLTEASVLMPGDYIGVSYVTDKIDLEDTYTITKVSHSVDVNNWFTTIELWKEF